MSANCLEINCTSAQFMFLALITYYLTYLDKYLLDSEFHNALEHLLEHEVRSTNRFRERKKKALILNRDWSNDLNDFE